LQNPAQHFSLAEETKTYLCGIHEQAYRHKKSENFSQKESKKRTTKNTVLNFSHFLSDRTIQKRFFVGRLYFTLKLNLVFFFIETQKFWQLHNIIFSGEIVAPFFVLHLQKFLKTLMHFK